MNIVRRSVPEHAQALVASGVHPVLARLYAARGVTTAADLDVALAGLPTHATLRGIEDATQRLAEAIARDERIVVVADYDADGATACAVAVRGLRELGGNVEFVVPNRFEFGYGLTPEIVALAAEHAPRLIVTVDNGIASHEGVAAAAARGIDVLVTDHHLPAATLPVPAWIVNPNQPGCAFPCKHLAGVGVIFYVLIALRALLRARGVRTADRMNLASLLDLVALGTVADVVRLDRVNRTLVAQGLKRIRAGRARPGVHALLACAGRDPARATTYDLGFVAGPRLNAAGRLADMSLGIRCLLADSIEAARPLAMELDRLNRERRDVEAQMQETALVDLATRAAEDLHAGERYSLCLYRPEWHQGVIGIVAARLKDRFHRPCIVFAQGGNGELKGSGRSIPGLHLRDALDLVAKREPGSVLRFGGHAFAAGVSLSPEALPRFAQAFEEVACSALSAADLRRCLDSDGALAPGELDMALVGALESEVWGQGFPPPVFDDSFDVIGQHAVGERHLRLALGRMGERFEAILFNCTEVLPPRIHAAYRPERHEWNGTYGLELVIQEWSPA